MKTQLVTLLLFVAPLMLQVMLSENSPVSEPATPASAECCSKDDAPAEKTSSAPATKPASAKPASSSSEFRTPASGVRKPSPPAKAGPRVPAKLAPWFM